MSNRMKWILFALSCFLLGMAGTEVYKEFIGNCRYWMIIWFGLLSIFNIYNIHSLYRMLFPKV